MKKISVVYPSVKRDFDGKITEFKLTVIGNNDLLGLKMVTPDKSAVSFNEVRDDNRRTYINF